MSNPESFIEEVNEEVRSERLFNMMKKYGWIAVLIVVVLVGGAAFTEFRKAQKTIAAQNLGDQILTAMDNDDAQPRVAALSEIEATGPAAAVVAFLQAGQTDADDAATQIDALNAVAIDQDVAPIYRDIAAFKAVTHAGNPASAEERSLVLQGLTAPGGVLRLLAVEQLALITLEQGDADAALKQLQAILRDAEITRGQSQRLRDLVIALGGDPAESFVAKHQ